ncbi:MULTISPECIES: hypothetical protein [unclassified Paraflavitalea]|uniref:hypothetical protein n=1 Tax=unclassified Paraflavitalea TaxID=2798305 RepID=UPI003D33433C
MQPVKISIQGDYIDCQIYRGRLYLWTFDGKIKVYKWDELVYSLPNSKRDALPLKFCFLDGNYLYKSDLVELFLDEDFKNILIEKFSILSKQDYVISERLVDKFLYGEQDTPRNTLPTDTEIYGSMLYYITEQGLFSSTAHRDNRKYPVSTKSTKIWDCNLLAIRANKYPQLALSGGNEGLFEFDMSTSFRRRWNLKDPVQISKKHSSFANYTYWSIYNSSLTESSYMALFELKKADDSVITDEFDFGKSKFQREFKGEITEERIFEGMGDRKNLSWGIDDKIYRATDNGFEIVRFRNNPNKEKGEEQFTQLQNLDLQAWKGRVIGGGTSYYGTIVECENALVVLLSNGESITIEGPITRWRVYPRSMNYQNHLHVIKDDRIEVYSFNQDYFLDQNEKLIGLEHRTPKIWHGRDTK